MKTLDLNLTVTSKALNESMFKKFGTRVNLEKYTREELENYRNIIRTKLSQSEGNAGFNELLANEDYQKDKHMLELLNSRIKEMLGESILNEKSKSEKQARTMAAAAHNPKFAKKVGIKTSVAKEFNKKDKGTKLLSKAMKHKKKKKKKVKESLTTAYNGKYNITTMSGYQNEGIEMKTYEAKKKGDGNLANNYPPYDKVTRGDVIAGRLGRDDKGGKAKKKTSKKPAKKSAKKVKEDAIRRRNYAVIIESLKHLIRENEEDKAKDISGSADMVSDITNFMQRLGTMQTKTMIDLSDSIRKNFGQSESDAFRNSIDPALKQALDVLTQVREAISSAVAQLAGGELPQAAMGSEPVNPSSSDSMNTSMTAGMSDEFGASDAASGGFDTAGREKRESIERSKARRLSEAHSLMTKLSK
jgi:hypothetical protein